MSDKDDCISRQAALDMLDEQIELCNKALSAFDISLKDEYAVKVEKASLKAYKEQLENLPSAQPNLQPTCNQLATDTISRQAAIDAIEKAKTAKAPDGEVYVAKINAEMNIQLLPSARPEQRWIPIKNRLPAVRCCRCLITRDDGRGRATVEEALFSFGRWYGNEWLEDGRNRKFNISESVIAWAPFPAPYRGGEK